MYFLFLMSDTISIDFNLKNNAKCRTQTERCFILTDLRLSLDMVEVLIALRMKAASTSEKPVTLLQTTCRRNPQDNHVHTCRCENPKSHARSLKYMPSYDMVFTHRENIILTAKDRMFSERAIQRILLLTDGYCN